MMFMSFYNNSFNMKSIDNIPSVLTDITEISPQLIAFRTDFAKIYRDTPIQDISSFNTIYV